MTHVGIFEAMTKQRKPQSNIRCASSILYFTCQGLYKHAQHYTNSAQLCSLKWAQIGLRKSIKQIHDYSLHIRVQSVPKWIPNWIITSLFWWKLFILLGLVVSIMTALLLTGPVGWLHIKEWPNALLSLKLSAQLLTLISLAIIIHQHISILGRTFCMSSTKKIFKSKLYTKL